MERRPSQRYPHPPAWRGVASPGYLHLSHWRALVEELGGLREPPEHYGSIGEGAPTDPFSTTGLENMNVLSEVQETEELGELREFVLKHLQRHERLVLTLVYAEHLSLRQVAEVLELPEATVRQIFLNTLAELRARFSRSS